jgi:hypothetical protein
MKASGQCKGDANGRPTDVFTDNGAPSRYRHRIAGCSGFAFSTLFAEGAGTQS